MQAEPMAGTCWSTPPRPSRLYNRVEKPRCFRQRPRTGRAFGGLGLCSAVPVTWRQPLGDGETASQVRAEFTPYLYRGRANHLHMGKRRVRRRGGRLPARGRGSDPSLTAPRQPPHRLSFHKTNFKVNKAPGTRPLQPLYHRSGVFFLPPPLPTTTSTSLCPSPEPSRLHELPGAGFTGQVPEQSAEELAGPQARGEEESFTKAFRLWFYMIGTAEQHPSSGLTFHLQINSPFLPPRSAAAAGLSRH